MGKHAPRLTFEVGDQVFVTHLQHHALGQRGAPMGHEPFVRAKVAAELRQIVGPVQVAAELVKEARQRGVGGIAAHMDDARVGKREMDEADEPKVLRHLVRNSPGFRRVRLEAREIGAPEVTKKTICDDFVERSASAAFLALV